jgi:hypothetical protein
LEYRYDHFSRELLLEPEPGEELPDLDLAA